MSRGAQRQVRAVGSFAVFGRSPSPLHAVRLQTAIFSFALGVSCWKFRDGAPLTSSSPMPSSSWLANSETGLRPIVSFLGLGLAGSIRLQERHAD
jgi:hypothetical protein